MAIYFLYFRIKTKIKIIKMDIKARFIDRQIEHLRKAQDNMILLEKNLDKLPFKTKDFEILRRGMQHDLD